METQELYRGRLIDHIQLVVRDVAASRKLYDAVFEALGVPLGGEGPNYFWYDELFVSTADSDAAQGKLTGRTHLAFQAKDRAAVERFYEAARAAGGTDNGKPGVVALPSGLLRRLRARSRRQQHRGSVSRAASALGRQREGDVLGPI